MLGDRCQLALPQANGNVNLFIAPTMPIRNHKLVFLSPLGVKVNKVGQPFLVSLTSVPKTRVNC